LITVCIFLIYFYIFNYLAVVLGHGWAALLMFALQNYPVNRTEQELEEGRQKWKEEKCR